MRLYEINTRVHCQKFEQISASELGDLADMGFDAIWLMGVWQISEAAKKISRIVSEDFFGSPFAVPSYKISQVLGGKSKFQSLVDRAHNAGLSVIVDFVSNHMAIDSPWIHERPDFFIRSNRRVRPQSTSDFFLHESGEVIAFGRDPYFPPWHDTAQLDYTSEGLRARMAEVLRRIGQVADGVRCDMAMLLLRNYIRHQWYPLAPQAWFDEKMPDEFWGHAVDEAKRANPAFSFIAEAYWDQERTLLDLGFDLAYEKKLYDGLVARDPSLVHARLSRPLADLAGSLYFIENHDEPRAAARFSREENLAAAALILSLPGSALIHEGQMEGKREHLPVQRLRPVIEEAPDEHLRAEYRTLLEITRSEIFRKGSFQLLDADAEDIVGFVRRHQNRTIVYLGQIAERSNFATASLDLIPLLRNDSASTRLRVMNLLNSKSIVVDAAGGAFRFRTRDLGIDHGTRFCLIEVAPV